MNREEADIEIRQILAMSLEECCATYNVDTKEEIIAMIQEEAKTDEPECDADDDLYNLHGFISEYHCNAFLY